VQDWGASGLPHPAGVGAISDKAPGLTAPAAPGSGPPLLPTRTDRPCRPRLRPPLAPRQVYVCIAFAFAVSTAMEKTNVALAIAEIFAALSERRSAHSTHFAPPPSHFATSATGPG
jgi:hypothetical protein